MPQGGIDGNETALEAVKRELHEETGVSSIEIIKRSAKQYTYNLPDYLMGKIWKGKFKGQIQTWFLARFLGDDKEINLNQRYPEFEEWKWVKIDELPNLIVPFKKDLYKKLINEFKPFI